MVNILIANDNIYYAKELMNIIDDCINDVRISSITLDEKETIEKLNSDNNIDIILLSSKMPTLNGIEVINQLSNDKRKKYDQSIIIISEEPEIITKLKNDTIIHSCIDKICNMSEIIEKLDELVKYKNRKKNIHLLKDTIKQELQEIGYNLSHKGTLYLIDAISLIYVRKEEDDLNLKRDIYPLLAQKYNKPIYSIKSDIVKATDFMDSNCSKTKKNEYFSFEDNSKLTVKLVIYTVLNNVHKIENKTTNIEIHQK